MNDKQFDEAINVLITIVVGLVFVVLPVVGVSIGIIAESNKPTNHCEGK